MFYIHQIQCISPQQTFQHVDINVLRQPVDGRLNAIEPSYDGVPKNALRRMSKAVRIAVGAAMPIVKTAAQIDGIVIGTANGGMEDSIVFLKQVIEFDEGILTPSHFVQSTANAGAAQISLAAANKNYNITHVHRGLAFENALLDVAMQLTENPNNNYLLGGVDEISTYNYKLDYMDGWYKTGDFAGGDFYAANTPGSIAGEGAVMLLANNEPVNAEACVKDMLTLHTKDIIVVKQALQNFIEKNGITASSIDLFISGENGDTNLQPYYEICEQLLDESTTIARFKHICGEYPTASSFALWLACKVFTGLALPGHAVKKRGAASGYNNIVIYNCHKGLQHSFMLVTRPV